MKKVDQGLIRRNNGGRKVAELPQFIIKRFALCDLTFDNNYSMTNTKDSNWGVQQVDRWIVGKVLISRLEIDLFKDKAELFVIGKSVGFFTGKIDE